MTDAQPIQLHKYREQQRILLTLTQRIADALHLDEAVAQMLSAVFDVLGPVCVRLVAQADEGAQETYGVGPLAAQSAVMDAPILEWVAEGETVIWVRGGEALPWVLPELASVVALPLPV